MVHADIASSTIRPIFRQNVSIGLGHWFFHLRGFFIIEIYTSWGQFPILVNSEKFHHIPIDGQSGDTVRSNFQMPRWRQINFTSEHTTPAHILIILISSGESIELFLGFTYLTYLLLCHGFQQYSHFFAICDLFFLPLHHIHCVQ